jgi:hypothetical protein
VPRANVGNRGNGLPCHYLPCSSDRAASGAAPWWLCNRCKAIGKVPLPNPPCGRLGKAPSSQRGLATPAPPRRGLRAIGRAAPSGERSASLPQAAQPARDGRTGALSSLVFALVSFCQVAGQRGRCTCASRCDGLSVMMQPPPVPETCRQPRPDRRRSGWCHMVGRFARWPLSAPRPEHVGFMTPWPHPARHPTVSQREPLGRTLRCGLRPEAGSFEHPTGREGRDRRNQRENPQ